MRAEPPTEWRFEPDRGPRDRGPPGVGSAPPAGTPGSHPARRPARPATRHTGRGQVLQTARTVTRRSSFLAKQPTPAAAPPLLPSVPPAVVPGRVVPPLVPLVADARSGDPTRGPLALAVLLDSVRPQLARLVAVWAAGAAGGVALDPEVLLTEIQLDLVSRLGRCQAETDAQIRAWVSVQAHGWLVRHAASADRYWRHIARRGVAA